MLSKTEIDQAIIAIAETKSPQAAIIRRHAGAIVEAMAAGAPMKEILSALFELTGVKIDQRWAYRILESERKKPKAAPVTKLTPSLPRASVMVPAPAPVTVPLANTAPTLTINTNSGWELEHQDAILPPELLKKAFVEIAGIRVDLRQPCPAEFGEKGEEVRHKVNPSSPTWPEFKARARARTAYAQDLSYWQREFKKWLISQGFTEAQY